ncbi:aldehyde dehydrogenase family protein [Enterococcus avium]|jgi:succinate-semialdehyde dehydrogenase|uniref:aldehyde dehydrogenase family protein n=1 Tax=Enterococcus avium TaxID=33945 RepID=UPI000C9A838E|nr:aldehyde dehydrogenase family protein [Enterococcus avium]MDO7800457.1 aldehyde dehydrogenase family protein [Enterococcus avium]PNE44442.1 succinate-semialdehyde dehydrogenase [Enterococcus avium]
MAMEEMVQRARVAMEEISGYTQAEVDKMLYAISKAVFEQAEPLAKLAIEETGLGRLDHKIGKNQGMATNIFASLKNKASVGVIREIPEEGLVEIAHPRGVIGSVTPTTNPTITPLGNGLMALKGKNAMIVSPHPRSKKTTKETIELMREALVSVGAPRDLLQVIEEPSIELSQELMKSVDLIVATGGPGLVKSAYSSGHPAYGVGPGNVQAILDRDFDVEVAAELSVIGRSFDNGIVCACQQSLFYPQEKEIEVLDALRAKQAAVFTEEADLTKLRDTLFIDGKANPAMIGQDPQVIAEAAGVEIPEDSQIIAVKVDAVGSEELFCKEKMAPVLALKSYDDFEEGVAFAQENLLLEGSGHSAGLFSHSKEHKLYAGEVLPVSRLVVNQPTIDAGGSPANGLNPTVSLGCGSWGNNIISENLTYTHLINISRIAVPITPKHDGNPWD